MAQVLSLSSAIRTPVHGFSDTLAGNPCRRWAALRQQSGSGGRLSCFFSDGRKQEQAKKALESALGQKKTEFEKWNNEIKRRQERGGGGAAGRGGWFGGGGWFGWFGDEHFWEDAQQAILAIVGIALLYLLMAKGNVMFAMVFNSLLSVLRNIRSFFTLPPQWLSKQKARPVPVPASVSVDDKHQAPMSAKERVVRKWGMD